MSGWLPILAARAAQAGVRTKSCVLLWMDGGPSHKDTFDLRPGHRARRPVPCHPNQCSRHSHQ